MKRITIIAAMAALLLAGAGRLNAQRPVGDTGADVYVLCIRLVAVCQPRSGGTAVAFNHARHSVWKGVDRKQCRARQL